MSEFSGYYDAEGSYIYGPEDFIVDAEYVPDDGPDPQLHPPKPAPRKKQKQ